MTTTNLGALLIQTVVIAYYLPLSKNFLISNPHLCIDVLSVILTKGKCNIGKPIEWRDIAMDLILHWVFCSVYTKSVKIVREKLRSIRECYRALAKIPYKSRDNKYYAKLDVF